jgi:hypothetical protein
VATSATSTTVSGGTERPLTRNEVVELFGTPDETLGSVNEPRLRVENGVEFNEKWTYRRPSREPSRPRDRILYWQRYDFIAAIRVEQDGHLAPESPTELRAHGAG